ncbi:hypothetical protein Z950_3254 [Sulfitobacter mediterraneus KCTC 32188]|nr:hypothetical protein Z950_3254 [Sulfitobacter mediterraneus KCTC 32188]
MGRKGETHVQIATDLPRGEVDIISPPGESLNLLLNFRGEIDVKLQTSALSGFLSCFGLSWFPLAFWAGHFMK